MTPLVIAFTGERGSGKSIAAQYLVKKYGFRDVKFAGPLKAMLSSMYAYIGLSEEDIERKIEGDLKESPCPYLLGKTPRHAMQTLGTEWREMIGTPLWKNMFSHSVLSGAKGSLVVCSDYRFPHETPAISDVGGKVIRIVRDTGHYDNTGKEDIATHPSETSLQALEYDELLENNGSIEDLYCAIDSILEKYLT